LRGGLQAYGILGIQFGPVIVTLISVFLQIYREEFADQQTSKELRELRFNILNICA